MPENIFTRGSPSPLPVFNRTSGPSFTGKWWWNAPRPALSSPLQKPLTRDFCLRQQTALSLLTTLPRCLRAPLHQRYTFLLETRGVRAAVNFLMTVFTQRLWPRIQQVNARNTLNRQISQKLLPEEEIFNRLPDLTDDSLRRLASKLAVHMQDAYEYHCERWLQSRPDNPDILLQDCTQRDIYGHIAVMTLSCRVHPLYWQAWKKGRLTAHSAVASISRLVSGEWWEKQLRSKQRLWREALMISCGYVSRATSPYASKNAIRDVGSRRLSAINYLKHCQLENVESGETLSLLDTVLASISNPKLRRMELMTLIAGVEDVADQQLDCGLFITLTTPSKYHPLKTTGAGSSPLFNKKWDKHAFTPKDAQRYLVAVWAKIRTTFKDRNLKVYGVRVVEPHHDGTPHWHMMLFTPPEQQQKVTEVMRRYALEEEADEPGAAGSRFNCKPLNRGGAAGYIAKYVAKNIDGYALDGETDFDSGRLLTDVATAVTSWASTWRIPQFHAIGIPSVGAWRECRRIRHQSLSSRFDARVEDVRSSADEGDFAGYIRAQGGIHIPRKEQTVRIARQLTGETNAFGEPRNKVVGIYAPHLGTSLIFLTHTEQWRIVRQRPSLAEIPVTRLPWSSVNNCGSPDIRQSD
ncbi:replication endonuclease [Rahnella woolbedingensis]|uniref:Replication endonuclease n=1 Tax=Rahnella woolbedingensis TaxID=1510574 RepID=A0A419N515_9GAMM|nr:replication endonuclease [Rahnella woolbedingensis]RJT40536.1 replication endonuclease [Rahnella woolbedingensis]